MIDQLEPVMEELQGMPAPRMAFHIRGGDKLSEDVQLVRRSSMPSSDPTEWLADRLWQVHAVDML